MLMAVNEPYALMVQPDDILISPREVDEHFGTMVCFHPRYALGDHHNYMDKDDFLREMYLDTVGHDEAGMKRYERMVNIVSSRFRHGPKTEERAIDLCHCIWPYDRDLFNREPCTDPVFHNGKPGMGTNGNWVSAFPFCPGFSGFFDPDLCCHLCSAGPVYPIVRRCARRDLGNGGLYGAAGLCPV